MSLYNESELGPIRNCPKSDYQAVWNKPIYQYLPLKYALQVIENKKIRFGNIWDSWEDSYELFMNKQDYIYEGTSISDNLQKLGSSTYGQCWSMVKETDAMWRIYSPTKESVRIQTTVGKMIQALDYVRGMTQINADKVLKSYLTSFGFVRYKEQEVIDRWIGFHKKLGLMELFEKCLNSCFIKRKEFSHENEIRFIITIHDFVDTDIHSVHKNELYIPINPTSFVEEVTFDPRLPEDIFLQGKSKIHAKDDSINVTKSRLYDFTKNTLVILDNPIHLKCDTPKQ